MSQQRWATTWPFSFHCQVLRMLMVDAFVTVLTVTPYYQMYTAITELYSDMRVNETELYYHLEVSLSLLQLTNVFSSPIIYFLFNGSYRVSFGSFCLHSYYSAICDWDIGLESEMDIKLCNFVIFTSETSCEIIGMGTTHQLKQRACLTIVVFSCC